MWLPLDLYNTVFKKYNKANEYRIGGLLLYMYQQQCSAGVSGQTYM